MSTEIPGARRVTVANATHLPGRGHLAQSNPIVRDFLSAALRHPWRAR